MSVTKIILAGHSPDSSFDIGITDLIIAGWTGRNAEAIAAHIEELAAIGVPRPKSTPIFYRAWAGLLTQQSEIQVVGGDSSGEAEPVLVSAGGTLWLGVGSDHTDRKIETIGITVSKQICPKPIGRNFWRLDEVRDHWDSLILRSWATKDGERRLYQEDFLAKMRPPSDLLAGYGGEGFTLPEGWAMFCGTVATQGPIEAADSLEVEIEDPVLKRRISHSYDAATLPVEG